MSQPRNNLEAFNRQLSAGRGGGASIGASVDTRPAAGKSKFKPAHTGGNDAGGFKLVRPAPAAGVRKVGSLQTFSSPGFGKPKPAPPPTSHSQPEPPHARIPTINAARAPPSATRFKPASVVQSKSSPAPRISAGGTIDVSPSGSESSMRANPTTATARKRPSVEVPLVPPAAGIKRLKTSPTPSERGSPVGGAEKENRACMVGTSKGKERENVHGSSLGSSQTLVEVGNGVENEDLRSKSIIELQHLAMYNMETVSQLKKDRKAFDFKIKTEQDVYLLDVFIRLADFRGQAIEEALLQCTRGPTATDRQPHPETQLLDEDFDMPPSPPPPPPPSRQANLSHSSDDYGSTLNADDEADFEVQAPHSRQQGYQASRQQSYEASRHPSADVPQPQHPRHQLPPMLELPPEPEPERDPTPEPEPEPEVTEIMSDDEAAFWNYGPTTQDIDDVPTAFGFEDADDDEIEVLDTPPRPIAAPSISSSVNTANPSAFTGDPKKSRFYSQVMRVLRTRFELHDFRPNQLEAIIATLEGRDVFTLMPTGGGKSLCFQLPAMVSPGVTVVFSPLIALMLDQTRELEQLGIKCVWYNMTMTPADRSAATRALLAPNPDDKPDMVYMTPERLNGNDQMNNVLTTLYRAGLLARFVIDEAHLIHTWGRNFRGSFMGLKLLRHKWPEVPIVALTATATPTAQEDIMSILGMSPTTLRLSQSFNRSNLRYTVIPKPRSVVKEIIAYIKDGGRLQQTGIVYCLGRDKCELVADKLAKEGISARYFHANMDQGDKARVLEAWKDGRIKVIVATIAFGMGINKPDVRFVIHHDVPTSMAGYLQETGRAGRDGLDSDCVLYYSYMDSQFHLKRNREDTALSEEERNRLNQDVRDIVEFATNLVDCRRVQLLQRFNEPFDPSNCNRTCDNCQNDSSDVVTTDCSVAASDMVRLVKQLQDRGIGKVPRGTLIAAFRGKTPKEVVEKGLNHLEGFGVGKDVDLSLAERIFDKLMTNCVLATQVEVTMYPANYVRLGEYKLYQPWLEGRETLEMRTRVAVGKGKRAAGGRTNSRKKVVTATATATARNELASDPIEDDEPTRGLWQDDDAVDVSYAREPEESVAGPSRPKRTKPASRRAPPEPEPDPEEDTIEVRSPGAGEDWHDLCYKKLLEVRQQLTEDLVEPEDVLSDLCLQMLSVHLPADGAAFTAVLVKEFGDENVANEKFRKYGRWLLDVCVTYSMCKSGRSVPPTPVPAASSSAARQANGKRKFKPAISEPTLPSASQLHRAYDYQGTPKPLSIRGR